MTVAVWTLISFDAMRLNVVWWMKTQRLAYRTKGSFNLIFAPGFSSKEQISNISGRGVGMDVVKTAINTLNGSIDIDSENGSRHQDYDQGSTDACDSTNLDGRCCGSPFALPLASVNEIFHLDLSRTNVVDGQLTIIVRDKSYPVVLFAKLACTKSRYCWTSQRTWSRCLSFSLVAKELALLSIRWLAKKKSLINLDKLLQGSTPGMAGATITSDGHIALILVILPDLLLKQYAAASRI